MSPHTPNAGELLAELRQFTGDLMRYRHPLNRSVLYTPGVQHLAERAEAYWLIDAIASWIGTPSFNKAVQRDPRIGELHFWKLQVDLPKQRGVLSAVADSDAPPFITQKIPYTDFLLDEVNVWAGYDGEFWTLYLPSEH